MSVQSLIDLIRSHSPRQWDPTHPWDDDDSPDTTLIFGQYSFRDHIYEFNLFVGLSRGPHPLVLEYDPRSDRYFQGVHDATWSKNDDCPYIRDNVTHRELLRLIDELAVDEATRASCKALVNKCLATPIEKVSGLVALEALTDFTYFRIEKVSKLCQLYVTVWVDPEVIEKQLYKLTPDVRN